MFKQGMFLIDPNASPEQIKAQREALQRLQFGRASNIGEGVGDLMQGIGAGLQKRGLNRAESSGRESAMASFKDFLSGGFGGQNVETGGFSPSFQPETGGPVVAPSPERQPPIPGIQQTDGGLKSGILSTAQSLGIDPVDLATAISYETAGTFSPTKKGPTTQWGQHKGLIQFGEPQAKKYGVDWNNPIGSQLGPDGAVAKYLTDTGVKPGMGMLDIYSAINAGGVGRYDRSDANNGGAPGTVADKVNNQMAGHRAKALAMFGGAQPQGAAQAVNAMAGQQPEPILDPMAYNAQHMRQSPDLGGEGPQIDPARMAPGGQPMVQGRGALASALANQAQALPAQQAITQAAPQEENPLARFNSPQLNAADPNVGILQALLARGGEQVDPNAPPRTGGIIGSMLAGGFPPAPQAPQQQAQQTPAQMPQEAPQAAQAQPAPQGQGMDQQWLQQALTLANNPFLPAGERAALQTMIQQRMEAADPMRQLEIEYKKAQLDQIRDPQPKPTDDIREYEFAKSQGYNGTFRDFMLEGKKAGATTVNVGEGSSEYNKALDKKFAEQYINIQEGAQSAQNKMATLQGLQAALEQSKFTGMGAETLLSMKQAGRSLGFDIGDNLGPEETARALGNQLALQMRSPSNGAGMPGAMSDKDREFLIASVPGLDKTPQGNQKLVDFMMKIEQRNIQVAQLAQEYADQNGQIDNGFFKELSAWSAQNPLFDAQQTEAPAAASKPISEMTDEELEALVNGE